METAVDQMLADFEAGKMTRRQLVRRIAVLAAAVASAPAMTLDAATPLKAVALDHISYQVSDYRRTRDFYADLLGMTVAKDNGSTQCELHFGEATVIARNRARSERGAGPRVDHVSYRIQDWDTTRVQAELERRGLDPHLDTGRPAAAANFASFHVKDPDGFDLQVSGLTRPGDALYRK